MLLLLRRRRRRRLRLVISKDPPPALCECGSETTDPLRDVARDALDCAAPRPPRAESNPDASLAAS